MRTTVATFFILLGACGSSTRPVDSGTPMLGSGAGEPLRDKPRDRIRAQSETTLVVLGQHPFISRVSRSATKCGRTSPFQATTTRSTSAGCNHGCELHPVSANYVTFEDDAAPNVYKQAGWDWLDLNVQWAKAHGIHLIFNMHVPQGGFQSNGAGGRLGV